MAPKPPTIEEFILNIFRQKGCRAGEMLPLGVFLAALGTQNKFRAEDLKSGFEKLGEKNLVTVQANGVFLTKDGFEAM
jgi:hypothetical protein